MILMPLKHYDLVLHVFIILATISNHISAHSFGSEITAESRFIM